LSSQKFPSRTLLARDILLNTIFSEFSPAYENVNSHDEFTGDMLRRHVLVKALQLHLHAVTLPLLTHAKHTKRQPVGLFLMQMSAASIYIMLE